MALVKQDVTIRSDSDVSLSDAVAWTQSFLDGLQSNNARDLYFADLFDARSGMVYRIFSTAAKAAYGIGEDYFVLTDKVLLAELLGRVVALEGKAVLPVPVPVPTPAPQPTPVPASTVTGGMGVFSL